MRPARSGIDLDEISLDLTPVFDREMQKGGEA
jgi:hypothetical protein